MPAPNSRSRDRMWITCEDPDHVCRNFFWIGQIIAIVRPK